MQDTLSFLLFQILPILILVVIVVLVYIVKIGPNIKIGLPILVLGIALVGSGIYLNNQILVLVGFLVAVFSLVFFPRRRRRWY